MFGLICVGTVEKFSLRSVTVDCSIRNLLATCTSEFVYANETGKSTEALFSFPLEGSCVVYHFEAVVGGKTIVGVCKEVEEAKNLYKAAKEAGQMAAMIERNRSMTDVFKCRIGNMPKDSEAKILIKFTIELKLSLSKSECEDVDRFSVCLPLILRPRYTPAGYDGDLEVYHVSNKYDYNFRASISGTKQISNVFSNNHKLTLKYSNDTKRSGQVTLDSKYDGTHDLDVYIDYAKMRVPSILYEYGTSSNKFSGKKVDGTFYQTDVAVLNFLPNFEKNDETQNKMEIVIVVDRSGSMQGSNIQHAKDCLLIFLKSLPTNCKFQIYGFGSTFDKAFPQPQLYDEQSLQTAMNYQRNIDADLGGTELMNPLNDLYSSALTSDYSRVVFLLTDGDVGNQDEVFKLVRKNNQSTRLFTVGIGEGVSTSLVQKVAESGLGKSAFVRDSKTLSASVIELLDIALNCDMFTDCKIEWQCPNDVSVVMVPSKPGPIFSNYFLTVFCMINGLKDGDSIKCNLSGHVNNTLTTLSMEVTGKNGISDDEFRVHRLLAKYKIDEMTSQIEDGKEDLKKSLIELSLEVNMVTNYTTFVAIDHDRPEQALTAAEEEPEYPEMMCYSRNVMSGHVLQVGIAKRSAMPMCRSMAAPSRNNRFQSSGMPYMQMDCMPSMPICSMAAPSGNKMASKKKSKKSNSAGIPPPPPPPCPVMIGDCGTNFHGMERSEKGPEVIDDMVLYLADQQNLNGSWKDKEEVLLKLGIDVTRFRAAKPDEVNGDVWMTVIVCQYLVVKLANREKEWRLFVKKAKQWLSGNSKDVATLDKLMEQGLALL